MITVAATAVIVKLCVTFFWDPGGWQDVSYDVYDDFIFTENVPSNSIYRCGQDYFIEHSMNIVAVNAAGEQSTPGDALSYHWRPDYDIDGDGIIGFADFGKFTTAWGKCDDGVKEVPCP